VDLEREGFGGRDSVTLTVCEAVRDTEGVRSSEGVAEGVEVRVNVGDSVVLWVSVISAVCEIFPVSVTRRVSEGVSVGESENVRLFEDDFV
jgi:hypothetical protein